MATVRSSDGTTIAYQRQGSGPPVLLVHGGGPGSAASWDGVVPHLASRYDVAVMDRRGRGGSRVERAAYSLELEADDIAAVATSLGGQVHVVAHSSGGRVALLAATRGADMRSLTLYEPPLSVAPLASTIERVDGLVGAGEAEAATELFLSEIAATPEELAVVRGMPEVWQRLVATVAAGPPEGAALLRAELDPAAVARIDVPVLLLVGELTTADHFRDGLDEVQAALGDVRRAVIPGQRHMATAFAPDTLAGLVADFLAEVDVRPAVLAGSQRRSP